MPRIQQSRAPKRRILGDISNISNTSMIDEDKPVKKLKNNKVGHLLFRFYTFAMIIDMVMLQNRTYYAP